MILDNSFDFNVLEIRDLGFTVNEHLPAELPTDWISSVDVGFSETSNWIEVTVGVDFRDEQEKTLVSGRVLTRFFVSQLEQYFSPDREYILTLPNDYDLTLFSLSFTHTRAILTKNLAGTKYSKVIVPLVNPNEFFLQFRVKKEVEDLPTKKRRIKRTVKN